ncbi:MAG TPA: HNH endonuclease, partial [Actinomycetota bacterium]
VPLLPPPLGAPVEVLDLGRATRVVPPALRRGLAVRDGGCVAPGCDRPPGWTDAHHLHHWLHGGATALGNLVLLCRVHHVAVHEGGWQLHRDPATERVTLSPPARGRPRGHPPPAA